jgi:hypothetical protein
LEFSLRHPNYKKLIHRVYESIVLWKFILKSPHFDENVLFAAGATASPGALAGAAGAEWLPLPVNELKALITAWAPTIPAAVEAAFAKKPPPPDGAATGAAGAAAAGAWAWVVAGVDVVVGLDAGAAGLAGLEAAGFGGLYFGAAWAAGAAGLDAAGDGAAGFDAAGAGAAAGFAGGDDLFPSPLVENPDFAPLLPPRAIV